MSKKLFKPSFERRLLALRDSLNFYFETGRDESIFPLILSCICDCWCQSPRLLYSKYKVKSIKTK